MVLDKIKIKAYFLIARPVNLGMVLLTLLLFRYFYLIPELKIASVEFLPSEKYILTCLSILFTMAAGNVINDIIDYKADLINKPEKIYIGKTIEKAEAFKYYILLSILGLGTAVLFNFKFFLIVLVSTIILLIYSLFLKRIALIGNVTIATLSAAIPLLAIWIDLQYVFSITNDTNIFYLYRFAIVFSTLSFFGTLAREIIKDIEDLNGDKEIKSKSLPNLIGTKYSKYISIFSLFILSGIILVYPPIISNDISFYYFLILVVIPLLVSVFKLRRAKRKNDFKRSGKFIKIAMLFTILYIAVNGLLSYDIF